jgi:hypothetical protein
MEIIIGRESIECNRIKIRKDLAEINGQIYNAKQNIVIPINNHYFDIFLLYANFCQIKKKFNFSEIDLVIESNSVDFQVNFEYDNRNFTHLYITMGDFYLYHFDEEDLLVFLSHELGHLIDIKNIYKSDKNNFNRLKILRMVHILIIILLMSFVKKYDFNNNVSMLIFTLSNIILALIIKLLKNLKSAAESRKQEYAADKYAVQVMGNLMLVLKAYNKLALIMNDQDNRSLLSSHPSLKQRIRRLKLRYWYLLIWNKMFSH